MLLQQRYIPVKKIVEFGQREVISFFTLVTNKGEHSIIYSKYTNIDWKRGKKKGQTPW
jgi:hypothetical protein